MNNYSNTMLLKTYHTSPDSAILGRNFIHLIDIYVIISGTECE